MTKDEFENRLVENCEYSMVSDWEQDVKTGKSFPIFWCCKFKRDCMNINECERFRDYRKYIRGDEE